jgi:hypothetical protein
LRIDEAASQHAGNDDGNAATALGDHSLFAARPRRHGVSCYMSGRFVDDEFPLVRLFSEIGRKTRDRPNAILTALFLQFHLRQIGQARSGYFRRSPFCSCPQALVR